MSYIEQIFGRVHGQQTGCWKMNIRYFLIIFIKFDYLSISDERYIPKFSGGINCYIMWFRIGGIA